MASIRSHLSVLSVALALLTTNASAGAPGAPGSKSDRTVSTAPASAKERGELARQFVSKWGSYVQRVHGVSVTTWAQRMSSTFALVDSSNFRNALTRDTFEGAMAELGGAGQRLSDAQVINKLAGSSLTANASSPTVDPYKFGDLSQDLVYTPVLPCRILDTRSTAAGAIAANSSRSFVAINSSNFTSQGGSATNCGTLGLNATAVAINVTVVTPTSGGYTTVFPFGTTQPLASSINYTSGAIVNNALIAQIPNPLASFDITIYTFAQAHYVADIVGYFAPPLATALQCVDTATTVVNVAAGSTANAVAPACAAGYTATATNCEAGSWFAPFVFAHAGTCSARNNDSVTTELRASRTCCRVPGR